MGRVLKMPRRRTLQRDVVQLDSDPRETPIYSVVDVAHYVGVPRSTLRHWLKAPTNGRAIIESSDPNGRLSFYNLLEAHVLRLTQDKGIPLGRTRRAVDTLRSLFPQSRHPLLEQRLSTAKGYKSIFIKELRDGSVSNLSFGGQYEFGRFIDRFLERIERDSAGAPISLRPMKTRHIIINRSVAGGRPVLVGTGILAEILAARNRGGEDAVSLAHNYGLSLADVKEAIKYSQAA